MAGAGGNAGPRRVPGAAFRGTLRTMTLLISLALAVSGFHGVVTRGPTMPVCRVGTPCSVPARGAVLVFVRDGRIAARVRTGAGGAYSVRLPLGSYVVRLSPSPAIGGLLPGRVRVRPGMTRADFRIDTGIR
jgi:hypothetical protein